MKRKPLILVGAADGLTLSSVGSKRWPGTRLNRIESVPEEGAQAVNLNGWGIQSLMCEMRLKSTLEQIKVSRR